MKCASTCSIPLCFNMPIDMKDSTVWIFNEINCLARLDKCFAYFKCTTILNFYNFYSRNENRQIRLKMKLQRNHLTEIRAVTKLSMKDEGGCCILSKVLTEDYIETAQES